MAAQETAEENGRGWRSPGRLPQNDPLNGTVRSGMWDGWGPGGAALAPPDLNQARAGSATDVRSARQSGIVTSTTRATTTRVGPTPTASPRSPYTVGADDEAPTESV